MKNINKVFSSNPFRGVLEKSVLGLLILTIAVSCKPKETDEEKSDKLFINLLVAAAVLNPCNSAVKTSSGGSNITVPSGQSFNICGDQNGSPTVTFSKAGTYRLLAVNGRQTFFASKCNSVNYDITMTVKDPGNTTVLTSSASGATADITAAANTAYTLTVSGIAASGSLTCQGATASNSISSALLTITPL
ncbi:hypothetical protein CH370_17175 [Leptospira kmetyi]|uniref:hypothetical protein n=1 Tax=Leptospira kmetyi TaxID=408139 RepID=UPI000C2A6BF6|nr:hypothetical protein [Leptospira kmetyi]PJZ40243.1 hypothetical protein CH370_17175 [Leptospira kmetyi]